MFKAALESGMNTTNLTAEQELSVAATCYIAEHDLPLGVTYGRASSGRCGCGNPGCQATPFKHPVGGYDRWTRRPEQILEWLDRNTGGGIFLNLEAAGLVDLDLDVRGNGGWREELAQLEEDLGPLPSCWRFTTRSGGEHRLFAAPAGVDGLKAVTKLAPHVELRVKGAVMLPPSPHQAGGTYQWTVAP